LLIKDLEHLFENWRLAVEQVIRKDDGKGLVTY
jgi:hypothetical protein